MRPDRDVRERRPPGPCRGGGQGRPAIRCAAGRSSSRRCSSSCWRCRSPATGRRRSPRSARSRGWCCRSPPRISGELLRVAVSDDEIVEAGTLLFEIDPTPFRLAVEAAEADLAQVGQSIGASTADVAAAQARVAEAEAILTNSRAQAERTLELVEARRDAGGGGRRGDRGRRLGRGDRRGGRGRLAQRRGGAGAGGRGQPAAARGAGGAGDGAVRPEPDADGGADARAGDQLQPRAGRDRHRRAAGADDDRPAGRLDRSATSARTSSATCGSAIRPRWCSTCCPGRSGRREIVSFAGGIMTVNQAAAPGRARRHAAAAALAGRAAALRRPAAVRSAGPAAAQRAAGLAGDGDGLYRGGRSGCGRSGSC